MNRKDYQKIALLSFSYMNVYECNMINIPLSILYKIKNIISIENDIKEVIEDTKKEYSI